jgi:hypothetical protein
MKRVAHGTGSKALATGVVVIAFPFGGTRFGIVAE